MPDQFDGKCKTCRWWVPLNSVAGHCRRMPPAADPDDIQGHYWPITQRDVWCGECAPPPTPPRQGPEK
jgi:hypothetical protein